MLFNSVDFAIFLPVVFVIYWFITNKNLKLQNFFIVVASYFFYGNKNVEDKKLTSEYDDTE